MQTANLKLRLKALFVDYLTIVAYLLCLAIIMAGIYWLILDRVPDFSEMQTHWLVFLTTIFPVGMYFSWKEGRAPYASFGKLKAGLRVRYLRKPMASSFIRNFFKFLPWQLGHYAVIRGIFLDSFRPISVWLPYGLAILLPIVYILMVALRKDHRHLPDLIAQSAVAIN